MSDKPLNIASGERKPLSRGELHAYHVVRLQKMKRLEREEDYTLLGCGLLAVAFVVYALGVIG